MSLQKNHNKLLLSGLALIIVGEAASTGMLPVARGHLFSLLTAKGGAIWTALFFYFINYFTVDFFQSIKGYIVLKTALFYRHLRTNSVIAGLAVKCLKGKTSGQLKNLPSNSPQRIQEDIKLSYLCRISVYVEYAISGLILVQLLIMNMSEPLLILFALVYAVISVIIAVRFNPRLTRAEIGVQQAEADYRTGLVASIFDITGQQVANKASLSAKWIQTEYLLFTKLQLGLIAVLPYAILLPKLLNGSMDLGHLVQHQATFALIVVNAAVLIQLYPTLIQGKASEHRVTEVKL